MKATKKKAVAKKAVKKIIPKHVYNRVKNGVIWLDATLGRKEWLRRMNMSKFDITDGGTCVAGNVFKEAMGEEGYTNFENAMENLGLNKTKEGHRLGFYSTFDGDKDFQNLQDVWAKTIKTLKLHQKPKR